MASATRLNADSSIEHTVEDYQVGGAREPAFSGSVIHSYYPQPRSKALWITCQENPRQVFFPHTRWSAFSQLASA
jgi:hypothetical protein